jgi:hypothetical protein
VNISAVHVRDIGIGLLAEVLAGASTLLAPQAPGLGITSDEDAIVARRAARRW